MKRVYLPGCRYTQNFAIIKLALEEVEARQKSLMPLCPFVVPYIKRHPEWNRLLLGNIKIE